MPSYYVHLAGKDYEEMELERRGLLANQAKRGPALAGVRCRACRTENLATAMFCQACRVPLTPAAEEVVAQQRQDMVKDELARLVQGELRKLGLGAGLAAPA